MIRLLEKGYLNFDTNPEPALHLNHSLNRCAADDGRTRWLRVWSDRSASRAPGQGYALEPRPRECRSVARAPAAARLAAFIFSLRAAALAADGLW